MTFPEYQTSPNAEPLHSRLDVHVSPVMEIFPEKIHSVQSVSITSPFSYTDARNTLYLKISKLIEENVEINQFGSRKGAFDKKERSINEKVRHTQVVEVDGVPCIIVQDVEKKSILIVNVMKYILLRTKESDNGSVKRKAKWLPIKIGSAVYNETSWFVDQIQFTLPSLRSIEEAHEYWKEIIVNCLRDSGLSEKVFSEIVENDNVIWDLQWQISQTRYGSLCAALTAEREQWKRIIPEEAMALESGSVAKAVTRYRETRLKELADNNWKLSTHIPILEPTENEAEFIVPVDILKTEADWIVFEDPCGVQISINTRNKFRYEQFDITVGGRINSEELRAEDVFILNKYSIQPKIDIFTDGADGEHFSLPQDEEWFSCTARECRFGQPFLIVFKTNLGVRCVSIDFVFDQGTRFFTMKGELLSTENLLDDLFQMYKESEADAVTAEIEISAGYKVHEFVTGEMLDTKDKLSTSYLRQFGEYIAQFSVFFSDCYEPYGEYTLISRLFDKLFNTEKQRYLYLLKREKYRFEFDNRTLLQEEKQKLEELKKSYERILECLEKLVVKIEAPYIGSVKTDSSKLLVQSRTEPLSNKIRLSTALIYLISLDVSEQEVFIQRAFKGIFEKRFVRNNIFKALNEIRQEVLVQINKREKSKEKRKRQ